MSQSYLFYRVEKRGHVAWVFLDRPEKKNAMGPDARREIIHLFADLDADAGIRAEVIAGEGKDFSAGIGLVAMAPLIPAMAQWDRSARGTAQLFKAWGLSPCFQRWRAQ